MAIAALAVAALAIPVTGHAADCTTTVSSTSAAATAVDDAAPGATVCLSDGTYGKLTLSASKAAPGVTVRAEHPGQATIAGATLDGSYLTVAQFRMTGTFEARPGSTGMTADHNLFVGGSYYAVMAAATTTTTVNDVTITNNRFVGRFDEDAIRLNRYHDGPDADPYGILIGGNEFTGNVEYGGHNDVVQSVWVGDHLYFRRNYLHDFGGQGFFVKDQASAIDGLVVEDNLIIRQSSPCDPVSLCPTWQLSPLQIFGPARNVSIRHNTVWPGPDGGTEWLRDSGWAGPTVFSDNVMDGLYSDATDLLTGYTASNNTRCDGLGFPALGVGIDCSPAFIDPANGDYRQANGRGVSWKVSDQDFGPSGDTSPPPTDPSPTDPPATDPPPTDPPPPADTTAPTTTITSYPPATSTSDRGSVSFTVDDPGATSQCQLDAGAWADCTSPYEVSGLANGSHTVVVRSRDAAGNVESPGASATWTVDVPPGGDPGEPPPADAPPTARLAAPSPGTVVDGELRVTASADDDHGIDHVEFWADDARVDTDTATPYTHRIAAGALSPGRHTIAVRAFDASGQAASDALTVRVPGTWFGRRSAQLSSALAGDGVTQLTGRTAPNGLVRVSLTKCDSADGSVADRFDLRADDSGALDTVYAGTNLCVVRLEPLRG
ncbi:MAG TPA: Ig-like domain-containing protein [Solirubrobacteraceae bacterium]